MLRWNHVHFKVDLVHDLAKKKIVCWLYDLFPDRSVLTRFYIFFSINNLLQILTPEIWMQNRAENKINKKCYVPNDRHPDPSLPPPATPHWGAPCLSSPTPPRTIHLPPPLLGRRRPNPVWRADGGNGSPRPRSGSAWRRPAPT